MALALLTNLEIQKDGATSPNSSFALENCAYFVQVDLNYLVAELESPCCIFILSGENFLKIYEKKEKVTMHDLPRIRVEFHSIGFVQQEEFSHWESWIYDRHAYSRKIELLTEKAPSLEDRKILPHQSKINTYLTYAFETVQIDTKDESEERKLNLCNTYFRSVIENKSIEWYFQKNQDEELCRHSARVSYLTLLFTTFTLPKMPLEALETLLISSVIHELRGNLRDTSGKTTSIETIEELKQSRQPISEKVLEVIRQHDEHFNGNGAPRNLKGDQISVLARIFHFGNRFDHHYLMIQGASRRMRMEQSLAALLKRKEDFDPKLLRHFAGFIQRTEIIE